MPDALAFDSDDDPAGAQAAAAMLRVSDERQAAAKKTAARKRARDRAATRGTLLAGDDPFRLHASFAPPGTPGDLDDEIRASLTRSVDALEGAGEPGIFPDIMADALVNGGAQAAFEVTRLLKDLEERAPG